MIRKALFLLLLGILLNCEKKSSQLVIKGSDTEVNLMILLAEAYLLQNPDARLSISGGGSGVGIVALLNGRADVANSSRPMNEREREFFRRYGVACDTFIFAEVLLPLLYTKVIRLTR